MRRANICDPALKLLNEKNNFRYIKIQTKHMDGAPVVVRLSVQVHFNLALSPRDSRVPGQRTSVCSTSLTVSLQSGGPGKRRDA